MKRSWEEKNSRRAGNGADAADFRYENRFFIEALPAAEGEFEIDGREASHAAGSRRLHAGEVITLFDGTGWDLTGRILEASPKRLLVCGVTRSYVGPPSEVPVTCAASLPKGSREDLVVSQCAQLGVTRLVPVEFERSVVQAGERWTNRRERFRRLAIEAAKQSGASTLMEMCEPVRFADLLRTAAGLRLLGDPEAAVGAFEALREAWPFNQLLFVVGPEGGLTGRETAAAVEAGFQTVRLAATTLRIETACVAFASVAAAFIAGHRS